MRLGRDNPIAREKIESGELSIVNASKVSSFLRQESKAGHTFTPEEKKEVIESVLGLSQSKCELALLARSPETIPNEKVRPLTETKTELKIVVDEKTMGVLERLKELLSYKMPNPTYGDLFDYLAREKVDQLERKQMGVTMAELESESTQCGSAGNAGAGTSPVEVSKKVEKTNQDTLTVEESAISSSESFNAASTELVQSTFHGSSCTPTPRIYISVNDRRWLMRRARSQCEHVFANGQRCSNRQFLDVDHIVPLYFGGANARMNWRIVCHGHNLFYAKQNIGESVMRNYIASLK
jgi:hypothetical protein